MNRNGPDQLGDFHDQIKEWQDIAKCIDWQAEDSDLDACF